MEGALLRALLAPQQQMAADTLGGPALPLASPPVRFGCQPPPLFCRQLGSAPAASAESTRGLCTKTWSRAGHGRVVGVRSVWLHITPSGWGRSSYGHQAKDVRYGA
jgi:hypothetical protein